MRFFFEWAVLEGGDGFFCSAGNCNHTFCPSTTALAHSEAQKLMPTHFSPTTTLVQNMHLSQSLCAIGIVCNNQCFFFLWLYKGSVAPECSMSEVLFLVRTD